MPSEKEERTKAVITPKRVAVLLTKKAPKGPTPRSVEKREALARWNPKNQPRPPVRETQVVPSKPMEGQMAGMTKPTPEQEAAAKRAKFKKS